MPTNLPEFKGFGAALEVQGGDSTSAPDFVQNPSIRNVYLNRINGVSENSQGWNGQQVWIVSHGWNGSYNDFSKLANVVGQASPNDIVLAINWEEASHTAHTATDGVWRGEHFYGASWIGPVAQAIANQLKAWGVPGSSVNMIGQSLGPYLNAEIAYQLGGVNRFIALDPASDLNPPPSIDPLSGLEMTNPQYARGYAYPMQVNGETVWVHPEDFRNVARFSRAFVGASSVSGNVGASASAHESIVIDFGASSALAPDVQHGDTYRLLQEMIHPSRLSLTLGRTHTFLHNLRVGLEGG
jgi:hypothetical protein